MTTPTSAADTSTKRARDEEVGGEQIAKRAKDDMTAAQNAAKKARKKAIFQFKRNLKNAVKANNLEAIEALVRGENLAVSEIFVSIAREPEPTPILHYAVSKRCGNAVTKLIELGADINITDAKDNATALIVAAHHGYTEICSSLIQAGAKVDVFDRDGDSALYAAVNASHVDTVRLLIEKGMASISARPSDLSMYVVECAAVHGNIEIFELLVKAGSALRLSLHLSIEGDDVDMVRHIISKTIESGTSLDAIPAQRDITPLMSAITSKSLDSAIALLQNGADPDQNVPSFEFPDVAESSKLLHLCANEDVDPGFSIPLAKALISADARVGATNKAGDTPLIVAARKGNMRIAKILVSRGRADVEHELIMAITKGESRECKSFLAKLMIYKFNRPRTPIAMVVQPDAMPVAEEVAHLEHDVVFDAIPMSN